MTADRETMCHPSIYPQNAARQDEFPGALREDRDPWHNAAVIANWTCAGIGAHEPSTKGGEIVRLPGFTFTT